MSQKGVPELRIEPLTQPGSFLVHHTPNNTSMSEPMGKSKKFAFQSHASMLEHVAKATRPAKPNTFKDAMKSLSLKGKEKAEPKADAESTKEDAGE